LFVNLLGIISFGLAILAFRDAANAGAQLERITLSLSTRYIGTHPEHLESILNELRSAERSITIAIDSAAYGVYSDRFRHQQILDAIFNKASSGQVKVRMIVYDRTGQAQIDAAQFTEARFAEEKALDRFRAYSNAHGGKIERVANLHAAFALDEQQTQLRLVKVVPLLICETPAMYPMHMWIVDDRVAIFSVADHASYAKTATFFTRDGDLIKQLNVIFGSYLPSARRIQEGQGSFLGSAARDPCKLLETQ
jgi:hypothetical protein